MKNNYLVRKPKATVCVNKVCATVEGKPARVVNAVVVGAVVFTALGLLAKALK